MESDDLLTRKEAALLLKVRPKLLTEWKRSGKGPPSITFNQRVTRYLRADLERYIEEHRFQPKGKADGQGLTDRCGSPVEGGHSTPAIHAGKPVRVASRR